MSEARGEQIFPGKKKYSFSWPTASFKPRRPWVCTTSVLSPQCWQGYRKVNNVTNLAMQFKSLIHVHNLWPVIALMGIYTQEIIRNTGKDWHLEIFNATFCMWPTCHLRTSVLWKLSQVIPRLHLKSWKNPDVSFQTSNNSQGFTVKLSNLPSSKLNTDNRDQRMLPLSPKQTLWT